jgi:hypothetical protein
VRCDTSCVAPEVGSLAWTLALVNFAAFLLPTALVVWTPSIWQVKYYKLTGVTRPRRAFVSTHVVRIRGGATVADLIKEVRSQVSEHTPFRQAGPRSDSRALVACRAWSLVMQEQAAHTSRGSMLVRQGTPDAALSMGGGP